MKRELIVIFLSILFILLFSFAASAICGDFRCDPEEGKRFCKTDCLFAGDYCCSEWYCQECSSMICKRGVCKPYNIVDQVKVDDIACFPDGSLMMDVAFEKSSGREIIISRDVKVEFKVASQFAALTPLMGDWFDGGSKISAIQKHGYHTFSSYPDQIKSDGTYIIRVKYRIGEKNQFGIDKEFTCVGIEIPEEPEEESIEDIIAEEEAKLEEVGKEVESIKEDVETIKENVDVIKSQVELEEEKREEFEEQIISGIESEQKEFKNRAILALVIIFILIAFLFYDYYSKKRKKKRLF